MAVAAASSSQAASSSSSNRTIPSSDIMGIGNDLLGNIAAFEKDIVQLGDFGGSDDEEDLLEDEVDPTKRALLQRIDQLEATQQKLLARFQAVKKDLAQVIEHASQLKQKLKAKGMDLPADVRELQDLIAKLQQENSDLRAGGAVARSGGVGGGGGGGGAAAGGEGTMENDELELDGSRVSAGTIAMLVSALTHKDNQDKDFDKDFFMCYQFFTKGSVVLEGLESAFQAAGKDKARQLKIFQMLKYWIDTNTGEFRSDTALRNQLNQFIDLMGSSAVGQKTASVLVRNLESRSTKLITELKTGGAKGSDITFKGEKSEDIAQQLTLIQSNLFRMVMPEHLARFKTDVKLVKRTALMSVWIKKEMIGTKKWRPLLKKFIEVAELCRKYNNFNSAFAIIESLKGANEDIKKTVPKGVKKFPELESLLDPAKGYLNYKKIIKTKPRPCVPILKFYGTKLSTYSDQPSEIEGEGGKNLINFRKWRDIALIAREIVQLQDKGYNFKPNNELLAYLQAFGQKA